MKEKFIAHCKYKDGNVVLHTLYEHLKSTGQLAGKFAEEFGNRDWGELVGCLHDIGKYHPDWQKYIRKVTGFDEDAHIEGYAGRPNHSSTGAIYLFEKFKDSPMAKAISYVITGHHSGLPDWSPQLYQRIYDESRNLKNKELNDIRNIEELREFLNIRSPNSIPSIFKNNNYESIEHFHLWLRMLFSCLVDADFLDTESFMEPQERCNFLSLEELKSKFDHYMKVMHENKSDSDINLRRFNIFNKCKDKAKESPGFFSLTVPTGGGKTLSSMAFALEHAIKYNKRRIIIAIPYTSIIEQTADIYKSIFGKEQVVEHHSNLDPEKENKKNRLASENWDAPIIVTTNVQLFESLLGNKTSVCRKLHNIVNSVIILDEAQMIPSQYLKPVLSVLKGLVNYFGVTVLLMSATQPAIIGKIGIEPTIMNGLENIKEIIDNPDELSKNFRRVNYILPENFNHTESWDIIAEKLHKHKQVLCIVNTRDDCRALHKLMDKGTLHLSGYMCGEERSEIINNIRIKLINNEPIRVISTQIVEAGVDIDFPVVFRALTGLDSIVQAAGRCNRENKIEEGGKVYVFIPPKPSPQGFLRKCEDAGKTILRNFKATEFTPSLYSEYFKYLYSNLNSFDEADFDGCLLRDARKFEFQFKEFAQRFNIIDDKKQISIIVKYKNSKVFIEQLRHSQASRELLRKLQRYTVNIPIYIFNKIKEANYIEEINGYWVQCDDNLYRSGLGLMVNESDFITGSFIL